MRMDIRFFRTILLVLVIALLALSSLLAFLLIQEGMVDRVPGRGWYSLEDMKVPIGSDYLRSAVMGGCYLVNCQRSDGSFNYLYDPVEDDYSSSDNLLRQLGTTYSILLLYKYYPEAIFLESGKLAMKYVESEVEHIDEDTAHLEDGGASKLGGAALAVLCYVMYEKILDDKYRDTMNDLGNFFIFMQKNSGEFRNFYMWDGKVLGEQDERYHEHTDYYPGEALLALAFLYEHTGEEKYRESWRSAFDYYYSYYGGSHAYYSPFSPWAVGAAQIMYEFDQDERYINMSRSMSDSVIRGQDQYPSDFHIPEYVGGFYYNQYLRCQEDPLREKNYYPRANTASKIEPPTDFYWMMKRYNLTGDPNSYIEKICLASDFLTHLQYNNTRANGFTSPRQTYGGVPGGVNDMKVRIDYNQHAIVTWLKIHAYIELDKGLLKD